MGHGKDMEFSIVWDEKGTASLAHPGYISGYFSDFLPRFLGRIYNVEPRIWVLLGNFEEPSRGICFSESPRRLGREGLGLALNPTL